MIENHMGHKKTRVLSAGIQTQRIMTKQDK